ncbi:Acetoin:2,6-dichlorophenolindophenol oxidoreductase subunit alpha [Roseivivax sp. THAF40]|uniref:thiamine pyrophosphate-dependent enzyme n=1 Tax=unclassified Roseivivax TaxID=2639302 RepID=UPI0012692F85|nr:MULTISPECIES: thiamine pyrophosphate-dependent enzyme [unclassified Roseivivax]QFS82047.1 Acetoin:2,6-dichlorophenolindophenol oxidoreductase subunit alpha [Roseivivax sp. THAF197b]QFT45847.1 Acetoin:2,6-dichlorophenolindophenol oxidoreductase subunit alpha [Roseivivax sp. THAF40]
MQDATSPDAETRQTWRGYLRDMLRIRRFEEKAGQLYGMGQIGGYCHLCIGQEAVIVGVAAHLRTGDTRVASHRCHGHMLAAGMAPERILAELMGRDTGYSGGWGGSMHMADPGLGFYGGHAIPGLQVPIGVGLAFAQSYQKTRGLTLCSYGDGAAAQGQVAEAYRLAADMALPILFVIENNAHAPGQDRTPKARSLAARAEAHGIPARQVDGMDVLAVTEAADRVTFDIRAGKGPVCLEMMTYRYRGHALAAADKAMNDAEMRRVRAERDPVENLRQRLIAAGEDAAALKALDREIKAEVQGASDTASAAPQPDAKPVEALRHAGV